MDDTLEEDAAFKEFRRRMLWVLRGTVRFVDLANEPDTTQWYKDELRELVTNLLTRLLPMVAYVCCLPPEAHDTLTLHSMVTGGTFALATWCRRWKGTVPQESWFEILAPERTDEERLAKAEVPKANIVRMTDPDGWKLRNGLYGTVVREMMLVQLTRQARDLLYALLSDLSDSPYADIVVVSRRFLPVNANQSAAEAAASYRALYDLELIERVDDLPELGEDDLAIRIVARNLNGRKHPLSYRDETFGDPGGCVLDEPTTEHEIQLEIPEALCRAADRWLTEDTDLRALREIMQERIGEDRVFIARVRIGGSPPSRGVIGVRIHCAIEQDPAPITAEMTAVAAAWLRERLLRT